MTEDPDEPTPAERWRGRARGGRFGRRKVGLYYLCCFVRRLSATIARAPPGQNVPNIVPSVIRITSAMIGPATATMKMSR